MNSRSQRPFINILNKVFNKVSAGKVHEEYQTIKARQFNQFFKFSLGLVIFSAVFFLIVFLYFQEFTHIPYVGVAVSFCILACIFQKRLEKHLNLIFLIACILLTLYGYIFYKRTTPVPLLGTIFCQGFVIGHISGTYERLINIRFSNLYFKLSFSLILTVLRGVLLSQVPVYVQVYQVSIMVASMITDFLHEKEDRSLFQGFYDYRESLMKFKNLVSSGLSSNVLILTRDLKQELFISDPLLEMAQATSEGAKDKISSVLEWLDQLIIEKQTLQDSDRYSSVLKSENQISSVLAVLKEIKNRTSFILSQQKLTLDAKAQNNSGKIFEIKVLATVWDDKDALTVILNDVTDHYKNISLQSADQNKDKMLAMISHELRTPLNGIIGVVNILKKDIKEPQQLRYLTVCHNSGELLLNLVNSILDLQQIRDKKFALKFTKDDLCELLRNIYDLFKFQFDQKNLSLNFDISANVPQQIITDQNRLRQILINLIGNALKFTFKGGVNLSVEVDPIMEGHINFRVSDTGTGIKEEDLKKLFRMYGRLDQKDAKTNIHGVGLGLEISNQLAILLAGGDKDIGSIKVESQVGQGTTFCFSIRDNSIDFSSSDIHEVNYYEPRVFSEGIEDIGIKITPYSQKDVFNNDRINSHTPIVSGDNIVPKSSFKPTLSLFSSQRSSDLTSPYFFQSRQTKGYRNYTNLIRTRANTSPKNQSSDHLINSCSDFYYSFSMKQKPSVQEKKHRILLVDDNPFNLLVAQRLIERLGYVVETALNGEKAVEEARNSSLNSKAYSVILMDLQMPVMDGFEATRELKRMMDNKEIPAIPIIAVSANDTEDDRKRCKEVGMYKHMTKPLYEDLLRKVLSQAIEGESGDSTVDDRDESC